MNIKDLSNDALEWELHNAKTALKYSGAQVKEFFENRIRQIEEEAERRKIKTT